MKKELNGLKDKVSKAVNAVYWSGKKYDEESTKLRELHAKYRAADEIRQEAFEHFRGLKDQLHEKVCCQIVWCFVLPYDRIMYNPQI